MEPQPFVTLWSNFGSHLLSLVYSTLMQWGGNCRMVWSLGAEHQWGPSWRLAATPFKEALCPIVWLILGIGYLGFSSGTSGQEPACQCRRHKRHGFDPWVGKIPWSRQWQPALYSCLENSMDWGTYHVLKSWAQLRNWANTHQWSLWSSSRDGSDIQHNTKCSLELGTEAEQASFQWWRNLKVEEQCRVWGYWSFNCFKE